MNSTSPINAAASYVKASFLMSLVGIAAMLAVTLTAASAMGNITHYEALYPIIAIVLQCVPCFISTRLTASRYRRSLLFIALMNTVFVFLFMLIIALIINKSSFNFANMTLSFVYIAASSILAILLPFSKRKRRK